MKHYAGIDVSLEESAIEIVDGSGRHVASGRAASEPAALARFLGKYGATLERVGLEAGPLAPWLVRELEGLGVPAICIETRRMKAFAAASPVKTDARDAALIAQAMRTGLYQAVHVKSQTAMQVRVLLRMRTLVNRQRVQMQNTVRGCLKGFGVKLGEVSIGQFAARVRTALAGLEPGLAAAIEPVLALWAEHRSRLAAFDRQVRAAARADTVCRRLMTVPGVGPVVALAYRSAIDDPDRFARSALVGAHLGLTPRLYASGEVERRGAISKCGDAMARSYLFEAANVVVTRLRRRCALKTWAQRSVKRIGAKRAKTALARKLAVVLHRIWADGSTFDWTRTTKRVPAIARQGVPMTA
jgi:transposase